MLINDARREARFARRRHRGPATQDRSLWDHAEIEAGRTELDRGMRLGGRGQYVIQAAIASLHAEQTGLTGRSWRRTTASSRA